MPIRSINNAKAVERCQKATGSILPRPDNRAMSDDDFSIPDIQRGCLQEPPGANLSISVGRPQSEKQRP
jgi:hypothetical protein